MPDILTALKQQLLAENRDSLLLELLGALVASALEGIARRPGGISWKE
jgi:hypothetical protein